MTTVAVAFGTITTVTYLFLIGVTQTICSDQYLY